MILYAGIGLTASGYLSRLYPPDTVIFASTHFNDARQYAYICISGYNLTTAYVAPTLGSSRLSWMPLYAVLQCGLKNSFGVSLIYAGFVVSCLAAAGTLLFVMLTLRNLKVGAPIRLAFLTFAPPISAIYLFLAGAEMLFLCLSALLMFLLTTSTSSTRQEAVRLGLGWLFGLLLMLSKPNALAFLLPLAFAFVYLSWKRSQAAGYTRPLNAFVPDLLYRQVSLWRNQANPLPIEMDWFPAFVVAGIILGFTGWEWYSSWFSGIPHFFTQQQLDYWVRPWRSGDLGTMTLYFAQAFRGVSLDKPYRIETLWYLGVVIGTFIPALSARVPPLIRGMILPLPLFLLMTGAVYQYDRYVASLILTSLGWIYWAKDKRWRWALLLVLALLTSLLYPYLFQANIFGNTAVIDR